MPNKKTKTNNKENKSSKLKKKSSSNVKKMKKINDELNDLKNKNVRLLAEFDNYKRRTADEKNNLIKYSGEKLVLEILKPLDDLKRTIDSFDKDKDKSLVDGIGLVYKKFQTSLENNGINRFDSIGEQFNPDLHEALMSETGKENNIVLKEFESGYKYHDRIIRHAKVVVSKKK